jgi:hypothetical protein
VLVNYIKRLVCAYVICELMLVNACESVGLACYMIIRLGLV